MDNSDTHDWARCCEECSEIYCVECGADIVAGGDDPCSRETAEHRQERLVEARAEANHNNERAQRGTLAERRGKE